MTDPTREQAIEECREASAALHNYHHHGHIDKSWNDDMPAMCAKLDHAATLLTRDGKLRERLEVLVEQWRSRVEAGSDAATWFMAAGELEAALKEG